MRTVMCLLIPACWLLPAGGAWAQAPVPPGAFAFEEVVRADSVGTGPLYARAKAWLLRRGYKLAVADSAGGRLLATNALAVYDHGYLTKRLHGKVSYQLTLEVRAGRYRQQFADFSFAYYHQDRTYQWVPTGKTKPLAEPTAPGWQKLWESHGLATRQAVASLAAELKTAMLAVAPPPVARLPPPSADW